MSEPGPSPREATRARLVAVAADLLAAHGPDAVTTRSVADAASVQAPTIYRIFGDKGGLLDAVVEHGFATYLARKRPVDADDDPVQNLRAGWDLHVGFGLENPALFRLMNAAPPSPEGRAAAELGGSVLASRVNRVARAGRLQIPERLAVDLIRAAGTGVVLVLIDQPGDERDDSLADLAWRSVAAAILTDAPGAAGMADAAVGSATAGSVTAGSATASTATAAVTLRAALPGVQDFTDAERALFGDWLERVAAR